MEILQDKKYLILEKPTPDTPKALRDIGRSKVGNFPTYSGCPYNDTLKVYDTGLDSTSSEFSGKDAKEVTKILKDRKILSDYLKQRVDQTDHKDQQKFLEEYFLEIRHNKLVDTGDLDTYLRLYLVMRGTTLTPENEQGNLAKYGKSMFKIVDKDAEVDFKKEQSRKRYEVKSWFQTKLLENRPEAVAYLKYLGLLKSRTAVTEDYIIMESIEEKVKDSMFLNNTLNVIKTVPLKEIAEYNNVAEAVEKGIIKREKGGGYSFDGIELGNSFKVIAANLNKKEFSEIAERVLN